MKLNSGSKQKFLRTVAGVALIAGLLPATNAFAVATFPTSGSCAMLITQPVPLGQTIPALNVGYNVLAVLNFTSATGGTFDYNSTRVNYTAGGSVVNPTVDSGTGVPFTVATVAAPAPQAIRRISITFGGNTLVAHAIAVNGGSTLLIQGASEAFSGVCQF